MFVAAFISSEIYDNYFSQEPNIANATVVKNSIFGSEYEFKTQDGTLVKGNAPFTYGFELPVSSKIPVEYDSTYKNRSKYWNDGSDKYIALLIYGMFLITLGAMFASYFMQKEAKGKILFRELFSLKENKVFNVINITFIGFMIGAMTGIRKSFLYDAVVILVTAIIGIVCIVVKKMTSK